MTILTNVKTLANSFIVFPNISNGSLLFDVLLINLKTGV